MGPRHFFAIAVVGLAGLTAGCDTLLLPASGPNSVVIRSEGTWHGPPYGLVVLSPHVVQVLDEFGPSTLTAFLAIIGHHRRSSSALAT